MPLPGIAAQETLGGLGSSKASPSSCRHRSAMLVGHPSSTSDVPTKSTVVHSR